MSSIFTKIVIREIPAYIIAEDDKTAFRYQLKQRTYT